MRNRRGIGGGLKPFHRDILDLVLFQVGLVNREPGGRRNANFILGGPEELPGFGGGAPDGIGPGSILPGRIEEALIVQ